MKYVKLFLVITLVLILGSGFFVWVTHVGRVASLDYVPDPGWSKRHVILPYIEAETYQAGVDSRGNLHTIWLEYDPDAHQVSLMHTAVDTKGKVQVKPHIVVKTKEIDDFSLTITQNSLRILWAGLGEQDRRDLNYLELNPTGEMVAQKRILTNRLTEVSSLQMIASTEGQFLASWAHHDSNGSQIQTLVLDSNGNAWGEPVMMPFQTDAIYPKLAIDPHGQIHMTWQEEVEGAFSLYYLPLTQEGRPAATSMFIDEIDLNLVAMTATEERIFIAWGRSMPKTYRQKASMIEKAFPNYVIFGAAVDSTQLGTKPDIVALTDMIGPAFDQNLAIDAKGQVNLLYTDGYYDALGLTQQIFGKDFTDVKKVARRLYPDQRVVLQPQLLSGPDRALHLVWMQSDMYAGTMYYTNTVYPQRISPLQIVGVNGDKQGVSTFMSLGYILGTSFYSLFLHLHFLILALLGGIIAGVIYLGRNRRWSAILGQRFVLPTLLCGMTFTLYLTVGKLIGVAHWVVWPKFYDLSQIWFITLFASAGTVYYIIKGKIQNHDIFKLTIAAVFWFYWMHVINFIFNLPVVNFI